MKARPRTFDPFANLNYAERPATLSPVRVPTLPAHKRRDDRSVLELYYPHVLDRVSSMWGSPALYNYLDSLWMQDDTRGGHQRQGFLPEAMSELMLLGHLHQAICPRKPTDNKATKVDGSSYFRGLRDIWESVVPKRR